MAAFSKWRSAAAPTAADSLSPTEEFATFLQQHGVILKGRPEIDGTWHRAPLEDDKAGAKSASYRAFLDGRPNGQIHNYKTGQTHMWVAGGPAPTPEELSALKSQAAATSERRRQELEATHAEVEQQEARTRGSVGREV